MFTRILTDLERRRIDAYLKADGEKDAPMRKIANRARNYLPQIKRDVELLEHLMKTYEKAKKR